MKALEKLKEISEKLSELDIESPGKEAGMLLRQGLGIDILAIYRDNPEINNKQNELIDEMVGRRAVREPLQYITGRTDFLGLTLLVGRGVLVPRPETELMAEFAIRERGSAGVRKDGRPTFLDLCTGSGCLALALAKSFPGAGVYGTDISETAIMYAKRNARLNNIKNAGFFKGHLFGPLGQNMLFDFIISNPPYIKRGEIQGLQPEIREWEPLDALDGGEDGLEFYREIIPEARDWLKDGGMLMFEAGFDEAEEVASIFRNAGYSGVKTVKDYSDIKRIIFALWTK